MKANVPKDCDNAPKRRVIRDFIIAWHKQDWKAVESQIEDDFSLNIIGEKVLEQRDDLKAYAEKPAIPDALTIDQILSHGKFGACNGSVQTGKKITAFAYFFTFKSAGKNTLTDISAYMLPV